MTTIRPTNNHRLCLGIDQMKAVEGGHPRLFPCQGRETQRWEEIGPQRKMLRMEGSNLCLEPTRGHINTLVKKKYPRGYQNSKPFHLIPCHERQYQVERGPQKTIQFSKADHLYFLGYDAFGNLITKSENEPQSSFVGWDDMEDNIKIPIAEPNFRSRPIGQIARDRYRPEGINSLSNLYS